MFSHTPLFYLIVEGGAKERERDGVVVGLRWHGEVGMVGGVKEIFSLTKLENHLLLLQWKTQGQ